MEERPFRTSHTKINIGRSPQRPVAVNQCAERKALHHCHSEPRGLRLLDQTIDQLPLTRSQLAIDRRATLPPLVDVGRRQLTDGRACTLPRERKTPFAVGEVEHVSPAPRTDVLAASG